MYPMWLGLPFFSLCWLLRMTPIGLPVQTRSPSRTLHVSGEVFTSTHPVRSLPLKRSRHWGTASWAVTGAERRFYFAGDTGYFDGFSRIGEALGPFDLAAVPIGAYEPSAMMQAVHLNPEEAVRAARDLRASQMMGIHFGTFVLTEEPFTEPPVRFRSALEEAGLSAGFGWLLAIGETRAF